MHTYQNNTFALHLALVTAILLSAGCGDSLTPESHDPGVPAFSEGDLTPSDSTTTATLQVYLNEHGTDADGHTIVLDGTISGWVHWRFPTARFSGLTPGEHSVELTGVDSHCTVLSTNPWSGFLEAGTVTTVNFSVDCYEPGVHVTTRTTGIDLDPDGYVVTVSDQYESRGKPIGINATVSFSPLASGVYTVELSGVAANCTVGGDNPRRVIVPLSSPASTTFDVTCGGTGT